MEQQSLDLEVFDVIGHQGEVMHHRRSGDSCIGKRQSDAFARVIPLQETSLTGDGPRHVVEGQGLQELFGGRFFLRTHPCVNFADVNRATGEEMTLSKKIEQKFAPPALAVQGVDDDAGIEKVRRHLT